MTDPELADFELPFEIDLDALLALPDDQREEAYARLQEFRGRLRGNPLWTVMPHQGEHGYKVKHGLPLNGRESRGQLEFLQKSAAGIFVVGAVASNRFGKTHINVIDAAIQTLPRHFIPPWLQQFKYLDPERRDVRMRFIGPDKDHWIREAIIPKIRELLPPSALYGGTLEKAWRPREGVLTFADGSWWDFLTHDMDLDAFASVELDAARFDEEPTGDAGEQKYDESIRGLADRAGVIRITLTPVQGIGWLHGELADEEGEPRRDDEVHVITGAIEHNPHISEVGRERAKKRWRKNPATYKARAEGKWTHREGAIFPEFVRALEHAPGSEHPGGHLRADRPLENEYAPGPIDHQTHQWLVPVFESIDPGINVDHPFAFSLSFLNTGATDLFGMDDVLETFYAFKEPNLNTNEQAAVVHDARARYGYQPNFTVIDPSAINRNPETGRRLIDAWVKEGIYPTPGQNDRPLTYSEVRMRITTHRWVVWQSLNHLIGDEMENYRWKRNVGKTENVPRPEPVKRNDDLVDTMRYKITRIPVWRGESRPIEDALPEGAPQKVLMRRHLAHLRQQRRRGGGKLGGVWG